MRSIPGTYTPHRGSYPEAAYKVLGEHAELSTSALADAIGCAAHSIPAIMTIPLRHGMLARTKRDGLIWWRRGTHVPTPRPADDEDDAPLHGKPGANGKLPASSIFDLAERQATTRRPIGWPGSAEQNTRELAPQHVLKAEGARPDATDRGAPANTSPVGGPMGAWQPAAAGPSGDFRVGLFCDGALRIEWRGQIIELEREQTEQLVRFLDRLAPEVAA